MKTFFLYGVTISNINYYVIVKGSPIFWQLDPRQF